MVEGIGQEVPEMPCDNAIPMSKVISRREERERRLQPRTSDQVVIELTIERSELINKMNNLALAIADKPERVPEKHQELWKEQLRGMIAYRTALDNRIKDLIDMSSGAYESVLG
jgi:hypothetical protein